MVMSAGFLFQYEFQEILEALRRDVRAEQEKCISDKDKFELHHTNMRKSIRLLEALNPKRTSNRELSLGPPVTDTCSAQQM